jgi:hypothetical protein
MGIISIYTEYIQQHSEEQNLYLNATKTKIMPTGKLHIVNEISVNNQKLEIVASYEYLGSLLTNNGDTLKENINRSTKIKINEEAVGRDRWNNRH